MLVSGNETCVQKTVNNNCCKFPFEFNEKTYYSCTKDDNYLLWKVLRGYFWCYIVGANKVYEKCQGKQ